MTIDSIPQPQSFQTATEEFYWHASQGRTAWWRYLLTLGGACIVAFFGLGLLYAALMLLHLTGPDLASDLLKADRPYVFYPNIAVMFGAWLLSLIAMAVLIQKKRAADIIGRWSWPQYILAGGIWLLVQAVLTLVDVLIAPSGFTLTANMLTVQLALLALAPLAIQTFTEEFIFRGFITQGMLLLFRNEWAAALVSGILFALVHIPNGTPQAINALVLGFVCSLIAIRTGGIAFTAGLHLANNYFGAVFVVSGNDVLKGSPGLFAQNTPELMWWDLALASIAVILMLLPVQCSKFLRARL